MSSVIEKYPTPKDYIEAVLEKLEYLEFQTLAFPLDIKVVANTITGLSMHCALGGKSPRMAAIIIWSEVMNGYLEVMRGEIRH
jgi:hypothetical protein